MRYMILITHDEKLSEQLHTDCGPEIFEAFQQYTRDIQAAGVMLEGAALHGSSRGARVSVTDGKRRVVDGPFSEAKEVIGGYYLIQVKSREEALEWAARCPAAQYPGSFAEVREVEEIPLR